MPSFLVRTWDEFVKEGDVHFDYMTKHVETLLSENTKKGFDIIAGDHHLHDAILEDIKEIHGSALKKALIPWIRQEIEKGDLFQRTNWNPFRGWELTNSHFGYRKIFRWEGFHFQLALENFCSPYDEDCEDCRNGINGTFFEVALWGVTRDDFPYRKGYEFISFLDDRFPDKYWVDERILYADKPVVEKEKPKRIKEKILQEAIVIGMDLGMISEDEESE